MLVHRPAIYEHAAALIGRSPQDALADAGLLFGAHRAAWQRYGLAHVAVGMDIYGGDAAACAAAAAREAPMELADLAAMPAGDFPFAAQRNILAAAARLRREIPEPVQVRVPITAAFSLAAQLAGFESLLIGLLDEPIAVAAALDRLTDAQERYIRSCPPGCGVTIFESAASPPLVRPADFEMLVLPPLARLMRAAREATGRPAELILGGHTTPILPMLLSLSPALVICDPGNDAAHYLAACRAAGVDLRINLEPRLRLPDHAIETHHRLESLARMARGDQPLFVATGVIPYDADPDDVLALTELVEQVNQAV